MTDYNKKETGNLGAAFIGALVGVASSLLVIFFSKKENRDKARRKFNELRDKGEEYVRDMKGKAQEARDEAGEKLEKGRSEAEGMAEKK